MEEKQSEVLKNELINENCLAEKKGICWVYSVSSIEYTFTSIKPELFTIV